MSKSRTANSLDSSLDASHDHNSRETNSTSCAVSISHAWAALESSPEPLDAAGLARRFKKGGKRIEQGVVKALASLVRWGHVTALPDGRFAGRSQRKEAA